MVRILRNCTTQRGAIGYVLITYFLVSIANRPTTSHPDSQSANSTEEPPWTRKTHRETQSGVVVWQLRNRSSVECADKLSGWLPTEPNLSHCSMPRRTSYDPANKPNQLCTFRPFSLIRLADKRERGKLPPKVLLPMLRDKLCSDHPSGRSESVMLRFSFNFIHDQEVEKGSRLANFLVVVQLIYAPRWQLYNIIHVFPLPVHGPYGVTRPR